MPFKILHWDSMPLTKKDAMHVNFAHTYYLSSHTATLQHRDSSAIMTEVIHDPNQSYLMIPHPEWYSQQKKPAKNIHPLLKIPSTCFGKIMIPKNSLSSYIPRKTL